MRRSLWLVAAVGSQLSLGACGDQPATQAPRTPHAARLAHGSYAALRGAERGSYSPAQTPEFTGNSGAGASPPPRHRSTPAGETGPTTDQLADRFAKAGALSVQVGTGSYYSDALAGRSTASGAPYEPRGFTAAHRNLPFGTVLRVTRKDGGQVVYVRVTDRGPYARGRILDLSRAAAERLGMLRAGVVKLKVEVLEYGPRSPRRRRR